MGMMLIQANTKNILLETLVIFGVFIAMILWDYRNFIRGRRMLPIGLLMIAFSFFWMRFGANWAFVANIILWFLYTISKRKLVITVSEEAVAYPSFPQKNIRWSELNNVIMKDDLLTIDCKNNKVYQHLIKDSEQYAEEKEFNDFCRNQLSK